MDLAEMEEIKRRFDREVRKGSRIIADLCEGYGAMRELQRRLAKELEVKRESEPDKLNHIPEEIILVQKFEDGSTVRNTIWYRSLDARGK